MAKNKIIDSDEMSEQVDQKLNIINKDINNQIK